MRMSSNRMGKGLVASGFAAILLGLLAERSHAGGMSGDGDYCNISNMELCNDTGATPTPRASPSPSPKPTVAAPAPSPTPTVVSGGGSTPPPTPGYTNPLSSVIRAPSSGSGSSTVGALRPQDCAPGMIYLQTMDASRKKAGACVKKGCKRVMRNPSTGGMSCLDQ